MKTNIKKFSAPAIIISMIFLFGCSGNVPNDAIEAAITNKFPNKIAFQLNSWKETNSYTRNINGEEVKFIEYKAEFELKKDYKKYLKSNGGISFPNEFYEAKGEISLVKRGSKWNSVN
ncbi:MAG: hypothetical protein K2Q11_00095 [Burkholderiaceae bacterium]|nr:hypothetical protein [Burkholderiaceae bacterium]